MSEIEALEKSTILQKIQAAVGWLSRTLFYAAVGIFFYAYFYPNQEVFKVPFSELTLEMLLGVVVAIGGVIVAISRIGETRDVDFQAWSHIGLLALFGFLVFYFVQVREDRTSRAVISLPVPTINQPSSTKREFSAEDIA